MKLGLTIALSMLAGAVLAIDHNNVDSGRPLRFDDAYSIAFRERAFETGFTLDTFRRSSPRYGLKSEFKYGFAKNQDIGIGFEPSYSTASRRGDFGNIELSYFNGLRREIENQPAIAYRVDLGLPTGTGAKGVDIRARGILTKTVGQYDRVHLNVDLVTSTARSSGERQTTAGVTVGYTKPLGYPTQFDRTLVAQFSFEQSRDRSRDWVGNVGLGIRQQVGVRSVLDFGIESDVFETKGRAKPSLRFAIGYSVGF
ncbi:hypothetical protein QPK87_17935 [Kamptonema cortianum]|nr:hypothetical protein [Kamptonema cortianum]